MFLLVTFYYVTMSMVSFAERVRMSSFTPCWWASLVVERVAPIGKGEAMEYVWSARRSKKHEENEKSG